MAWQQPFQCEKGSKYGRPCVLAKYHQARKAKPLRPLYCIGRKLIKLDDIETYTRPENFGRSLCNIIFVTLTYNIMCIFLQKGNIMLHFTLSGSSDITGCQCLLSYFDFDLLLFDKKKIEKTNSAGCKRTDANFHFQRHTIFQLFSSATLFIEGSVLTSSFPQKCVKWRQVKITNMIITRPVQKSLNWVWHC